MKNLEDRPLAFKMDASKDPAYSATIAVHDLYMAVAREAPYNEIVGLCQRVVRTAKAAGLA